MFAFLKGNIEKKDIDRVAIDVNGVGYEVLMPAGDVERINLGQFVKIHTFTDIKEGYIGIFGFLEEEALIPFFHPFPIGMVRNVPMSSAGCSALQL